MAAPEPRDSGPTETTGPVPIATGSPAQPPSQPPAQPILSSASADSDPTRLQELHKQAAKQAQKARVHRFLVEVDQSLAEGDQHVGFKTLKLLRPWQPSRRAQLKNDSGHILSPADELSKLRQYGGHLCSAPPTGPRTRPAPMLEPC